MGGWRTELQVILLSSIFDVEKVLICISFIGGG